MVNDNHRNRFGEPRLVVWPKPLLIESGIHHRLESCGELWNRLDEPRLVVWPKPLLIESGIHHRLESWAQLLAAGP